MFVDASGAVRTLDIWLLMRAFVFVRLFDLFAVLLVSSDSRGLRVPPHLHCTSHDNEPGLAATVCICAAFVCMCAIAGVGDGEQRRRAARPGTLAQRITPGQLPTPINVVQVSADNYHMVLLAHV